MGKFFIAVIEESPKMAFKIQWPDRWGTDVPDHIEFPDGSIIVKVGRYASPGDRYRFTRLAPVKIAETDFEIES
jgi:hypothetical protein